MQKIRAAFPQKGGQANVCPEHVAGGSKRCDASSPQTTPSIQDIHL
jgi:hypothetical protein